MTSNDRFGLSWRPELGMEILRSSHDVHAIEVMPEHLSHLSKHELKSFHRLARAIPTMVHGVSLGLASAFPVDTKALDLMARIVEAVEPEAWSEHLAFVRVPGEELGHLAAPPWNEETIESTLENIEAAIRVVGSKPHLENIATLYHPPGSTMNETEWISRIIGESKTRLLLDVENVYANSLTFGFNSIDAIALLPLDTVKYIHIAGGSFKTDAHGAYFLDDHAHAVSQEVFGLLEHVGSLISDGLTVILERDGNFPPAEALLAELATAQSSLIRGRARLARACPDQTRSVIGS